jgi:hypothetical protein
MSFEKKEMIEQLKFEIRMIEKGGYSPSVRDPRHEPEMFRESVTCLNVGLEEKENPCTSCFLSEFAPPGIRDAHDDLCHKIPLNEKGDTIDSLKAKGDPEKLQSTLLGWLKSTVARLEREDAAGL